MQCAAGSAQSIESRMVRSLLPQWRNEGMSEIVVVFIFLALKLWRYAWAAGLNFFALSTVRAIEHPQSELKLWLGNCDNWDASQ